jgi:hypothetical protein
MIASFCLSLTIAGCFRYTSYSGDGEFVDNGVRMYGSRYVLDLGAMDLETVGSRNYRLGKLPKAQFNIGIDLVEMAPNTVEGGRPDHRGRVRVELRTAKGAVIVSENAELQDWVWSFGEGGTVSRLYRRGESEEVSTGPDRMRHVALGKKASGGWGTYFDSNPHEVYILDVHVLEPLATKGRPARVRLVGWSR